MIPTLNYAQAMRGVIAGQAAGVTILLEGPPGVGKTSLGYALGVLLKKRVVVLIGANLDPTDVAGLPYLHGGVVLRSLFPELQAACDEGVILLIDELTTTPPSVRAALLRLILERNAGGRPLHPDTRILAACNAPEHAPSAVELDAASLNRVSRLRYAPSAREIAAFFNGTPVTAGAVNAPADYAVEASDFAATLGADPSLVQIEPPAASVEAGAPWASPRAWELGLKLWSADGAKDDEVGYALLAGCVGPHAATAWLAIRKLRANLPTADQIQADPAKALVPDRTDHQIAALGLVSRVAREDSSAAWVYTERLRPEIGAAVAQIIQQLPPTKLQKFQKEAMQSQVKLMARIHRGTR